jgi:glycosyltransferase involved in cell wall biosynthesis
MSVISSLPQSESVINLIILNRQKGPPGDTILKISPLVSVVTPSYNQAEYLEETILSVLGQDYPNIEYIIIDGDSTDGSVDIIRKYEEQLMYWVSEPDEGQADAINKGWRIARGQYLTWLNADDVLLPDAITRCVQFLEESPDSMMVYGDVYHIDQYSEILGLQVTHEFNYMTVIRSAVNPVMQPGFLVRREALDTAGELNPKLQFGLDFEYWLRLGCVAAIRYTGFPVARFRVHPTSKTTNQQSVMASERIQMFEAVFARDDLHEDLQSLESESLCNVRLIAANGYLKALDGRSARRCVLEAMRLNPASLSPRVVWTLFKTLVPPEILVRFQRWRDKHRRKALAGNMSLADQQASDIR